jgi:hypothetical protein
MQNTIIDIIINNNPNSSWIKNNLLFLIQHGSKAYNCHIESSDDDFKGICLPDWKYFVSFEENFEQFELKNPAPDAVIYSLKKFFQLAKQANPNILEMLYVDPKHQLYVHPLMQKVLDQRENFLSSKVRYSFGGFAFDQMRRLKLHRSWLLKGEEIKPPQRSDFNLPERPAIGEENLKAIMAAISKEVDRYNFTFLDELDSSQRIGVKNAVIEMLTEANIFHKDLFVNSAKKIGCEDNLILLLQKEREFNSKLEDHRKYLEWKNKRNPVRYADEVKYGYDLKFAYHIVRLYRSCAELLETGKLNVFREDREELISIRNGNWSYEQLEQYSIDMDQKLSDLYKITKLPHHINGKKIQSLYQDIVEDFFKIK